MPSGQIVFNFSFQLPHWAPPSFEGDLGFIRYFILVQIDRPWKFDDKFITGFTVLPRVDLSLIPSANAPTKKHICEQLGVILWRKGSVRMEIKIPKQGFVCGEQIPAQVKVDNRTAKKFKQITLRLVQRVTYTGFRDGFVNTHSQPAGEDQITYATRLNAQTRIEECKILEETVDVKIGKDEKLEINQNLKIPSLAPSTKTCEIIDVDYFLKAKLSTLGTFPSVVKLELPFIIGTVQAGSSETLPKFEYKKSVFGYAATVLKNRDMARFAPLYPVYKFK
uniref:Arrestin_C domain-containing protein n=1 Tax=Caenorhabditis japonica TaxID=281687 RepID=A0A8R1E3H2_CAEJA